MSSTATSGAIWAEPESRAPRPRRRVLGQALDGHPFLAGLAPRYVDLLARCSWNVDFPDGTFLFREGRPAETFFLILGGRVILEAAGPGGTAVAVQILGDGDVAGFSWLLEPHRWKFDGRTDGSVRAIGVDGTRLREACGRDPLLGYELTRRVARVAVQRLEAARDRPLSGQGRTSPGDGPNGPVAGGPGAVTVTGETARLTEGADHD